MMQPERDADPVFNFYDISAEDLRKFPNAIQEIHRGQYHGILVRGVFDPDTAAEVSRRIEGGEAAIERTSFPTPVYAEKGGLAQYGGASMERVTAPEKAAVGYVLGTPLMMERSEDRYLAAAARFRAGCRTLFDGLPDFEERMTTVFGTMAGGRTIKVPEGPGGSSYTPATMRVLPRGQEIGIHVGNDFIRLPQARWLAGYADMTCQLSYFVTLQVPEGGGELIVYTLQWADVEKLRVERHGSSPGYGSTGQVATMLKSCDSITFKPNPGDLMLFDGGRYYHRVTHIEGERNRITIGGFLLLSRDDQTVYYWS